MRHQNHAANSSAKLLRLQERWIRRYDISGRCQSSRDAAVAEHVSIAQGIVRMIQNIEYLGLHLEIL